MNDLDALLSLVNAEIGMNNLKLENRLQSVQRSRLLLDRINEALTVLRQKPRNGELMYKVVYETFITPEKLSHADILYRLHISSRHYYRIRQQAINILSIRLWAVPSPSWGTGFLAGSIDSSGGAVTRNKNELSDKMGDEKKVHRPFFVIKLHPIDRYLLASDRIVHIMEYA